MSKTSSRRQASRPARRQAQSSLLAQPFQCYPQQQEFLHSSSFLRGFVGGRGSGKTTIACVDILRRARNGEPFMGVSPTYGDVSDVTYPTFERLARQFDVFVKGVHSPLPRITFRTKDRGLANIVFRTGEEPDSLRGPSKAGLWLDEPSVMQHAVFQVGLGILRHQGRMGFLSMTFTPKGRRHWTYEAFYDRQGEADERRANTQLIRSHTLDNPYLPREYHANVAAHYTSAMQAQELAAEFIELEGLLLRREWFRIVESMPAKAHRVRYWDKAATEAAGDWSAGVLMARTAEGMYYVEDVVRGRWSALTRNRMILETAHRDAKQYGNEVLIYLEQEPGAGGKESMEQSIRMLGGFPVYRDLLTRQKQYRTVGHQRLPGEAKLIRARPLAAQAEAGNIALKRAAWNAEYLEELCAFPEYAHDDQVDASSGAFNRLTHHFQFLDQMTPSRDVLERPNAGERYGVHVQGAGASFDERTDQTGWFKR